MMSDMAPTGDWIEDGSFEDAVAHFDAQPSEPTVGPPGRLPTGLRLGEAPTSAATNTFDVPLRFGAAVQVHTTTSRVLTSAK